MIRLALPLIFLLVGLGGGVAGGLLLGPPRTGTDGAAADEPAGPGVVADTDAGSPRAESGDSGADGTEFVRLNNQFVVPIVRNGSVRSLVVMALTIEVDSGNNEAVFNREPRLRDSFLQVMFAHANAGGFDGSFTQAAAMDPLRTALGDAARAVLGDIVYDVLIVDITRQDA